jgi:predicted nuclease with TOPRIM domain
LAKVAMLLTSSQPGEVVAAAGRLVSMLSSAGMTPADLVNNEGKTSFDASTVDTLALHRARAEAEHFREEVQRQRKWYEEMLKERDAALARVEELEDEIESLQPELDWVALAEAFRRANRRGINSILAKNLEYLAYTNKLTLAHKRKLREFSLTRRGKRAA